MERELRYSRVDSSHQRVIVPKKVRESACQPIQESGQGPVKVGRANR